jgi:hypothetical protein
MHPVWLRCENSESAAADACVFAPCPTGATTPINVNLFLREPLAAIFSTAEEIPTVTDGLVNKTRGFSHKKGLSNV